ncbi:hypothetical protein OsJ_23589 [Oryza sativa Japonica Group]|uniref:NAC domain-containing protein n=1 Tax=Oryza sativa subsp. japonica TaxID=39947 RepID=A3BHX5_ORYSJ|nr:hypothetical protein OsJ_23589 [Oryza sativa Japonica Group]
MAAAKRRVRDAEADLNLPPGFRFHPTDEELVAHYLCPRAAGRAAPVPIIAELDLYRHDPWDLPHRALFGRRECPPAASRRSGSCTSTALAKKGGAAAAAGAGALRLDDWVLCRLYNKKNEWEKMQSRKEEEEAMAAAQSWGETRTPESEVVDSDAFPEMDYSLPAASFDDALLPKEEARDDDWLMGMSLDDPQGLGSLLQADDLSMLAPPPAAKTEPLGAPFF